MADPTRKDQPKTSPPPLDAVFTVLVAGHRQDRLPNKAGDVAEVMKKLESVVLHIGEVLKKIDYPNYIYGEPRGSHLRILTGACDGVDESASRIAIKNDIPLHILSTGPVPEAEPFTSAQRKVEIDWGDAEGSSDDNTAYMIRDRTALTFADCLLVVWDGGAARGLEGGTVNLIREAALRRKPIVWINTSGDVSLFGPDSLRDAELKRLTDYRVDPKRLKSGFRALDQTWGSLEKEITRVVDPVARKSEKDSEGSGLPEKRLESYFSEFSGKGPLPWIGRVEPSGTQQHPILSPTGLMNRFEWSDTRATRASGLHRKSIWLTYLLAASAVFSAVAGAVYLWPFGESGGWAILELLVVASIIGLVKIAQKERWHYRWLSHRFMAEQLRYLRVGLPLLTVPKPWHEPLWTRRGGDVALRSAELWLLQRALTTHGLPESGRHETYAVVTQDNVRILCDYVEDVVDDQIAYHEKNHRVLHERHHRLHLLSLGLFALTLASIGGHFILHVKYWLIGTAFLPALAASIHGIVTKLEISRVSSQSKQTAERLKSLKKAIASLREGEHEDGSSEATWVAWVRLRALTEEASKILSDENAQWQQLIREQEAELPA